MRKGWENVKLGDVCAVDKAKFRVGELPFVGLEDIESNAGGFIGNLEPRSVQSATFRFTPRHVLYGRLRPYLNKVLLPDFDGHCSSEIFPILPGSHLDRRFLYYWITSKPVVDEINRTCTGTRMPRANVKEILKFVLLLPPLSEQKRIVAILDEAFEGIGRAAANAEKNLANARELFESYLNAVFAQKGDGWVEATIGEVCTLRSGTTVSKSLERDTGDIPYLKVADMSFPGNETSIFSSSRFLNLSAISSRSILPIGTVIFPKRGGAIATNKKRITAVEIAADLNIMGVIPSETICSEFLFFYFLQFDLASIGSGSSIPQINKGLSQITKLDIL